MIVMNAGFRGGDGDPPGHRDIKYIKRKTIAFSPFGMTNILAVNIPTM